MYKVNLSKFLFSLLGTRNFPKLTDDSHLLILYKKLHNVEAVEQQSVNELIADILQDKVSTRYSTETLRTRTQHIIKSMSFKPEPLVFDDLDYDEEEKKFWDDKSVSNVQPIYIDTYTPIITYTLDNSEQTDEPIQRTYTPNKRPARVSKINAADWF